MALIQRRMRRFLSFLCAHGLGGRRVNKYNSLCSPAVIEIETKQRVVKMRKHPTEARQMGEAAQRRSLVVVKEHRISLIMPQTERFLASCTSSRLLEVCLEDHSVHITSKLVKNADSQASPRLTESQSAFK